MFSTRNMVHPFCCSSDSVSVDTSYGFVCYTLGLYLTAPFSFQLVTGDYFVLVVNSDINASSVLFSDHYGIFPFCEYTGAADGFLHNDSIGHLFLSVTYSLGLFTCVSVYHTSCFLPSIEFRRSNLRHITEWPPNLKLF